MISMFWILVGKFLDFDVILFLLDNLHGHPQCIKKIRLTTLDFQKNDTLSQRIKIIDTLFPFLNNFGGKISII